MLCLRFTVRIPMLCAFIFWFYRVRTCTYRVHTKYSPSTYGYILAKVLKFQVQTSTYSVGTVLQWYVPIYSTKPLVLACSGTYLLVMHVTILRISTFLFGTWYIQICTAIRAVQIHMYQVPNRNVEVLRIVTCITRRYVPLQTSTSGFVQ